MENQIEEIWKPVDCYEGIYEASNTGFVRSVKTKKIIQYDKNRYKRTKLYRDRKGTTYYVHRIVAKVFLPNVHDKPHVNHIDNNPSNNHISNLEWCTHSENMKHASNQGRMNGKGKIVIDSKSGLIYETIEKAAKIIGVKPNTLVYRIRRKSKLTTLHII